VSDDFVIPGSAPAAGGLPFAGESEGVEIEETTEFVPPESEKEVIEPSELAGDSEKLEEEAVKTEAPAQKKLFTEEELDKFWDATLANEPYLESMSLGKGKRKLSFTFKTKGTSELNEIAELMEEESITMKARWDLIQSQYLLAASLHSYNRKLLPTKDTEKRTVLQLKRDFLDNLPSPVASGLLFKLQTFDAKIAAMQQEVFSEDF
jgi:hypothetical protein